MEVVYLNNIMQKDDTSAYIVPANGIYTNQVWAKDIDVEPLLGESHAQQMYIQI